MSETTPSIEDIAIKGACIYFSKDMQDDNLAQPPAGGKRLLEPLKTLAAGQKLPMNILEDAHVVNEAEVHAHEADLWMCLEGEVKFTYGGRMVDPYVKIKDGIVDAREWKAKTIAGGTDVILKPGDWLWIPAGQPHQHSCEGVARLIIIKIPQP